MGMKGMEALQRRVSLPHVSALALCLAALWSTPLQANGFENFEDAELIDHIAGTVSRDYGQMYGYQVGFKLIGKEVLHHSALLVQYNAHQKHCTFLLSTRDRNWYNFRQYMKFFKELPKKVVYEAFFAHESGHCVQKRKRSTLARCSVATEKNCMPTCLRFPMLKGIFRNIGAHLKKPCWTCAVQPLGFKKTTVFTKNY